MNNTYAESIATLLWTKPIDGEEATPLEILKALKNISLEDICHLPKRERKNIAELMLKLTLTRCGTVSARVIKESLHECEDVYPTAGLFVNGSEWDGPEYEATNPEDMVFVEHCAFIVLYLVSMEEITVNEYWNLVRYVRLCYQKTGITKPLSEDFDYIYNDVQKVLVARGSVSKPTPFKGPNDSFYNSRYYLLSDFSRGQAQRMRLVHFDNDDDWQTEKSKHKVEILMARTAEAPAAPSRPPRL